MSTILNPIAFLRRLFLLRLAFKLLRSGHAYDGLNAVSVAAAMWAATAGESPLPSRHGESP